MAQLGASWECIYLWFLPRAKWVHRSENQASPAVCVAQEDHFFLGPYRVLRVEWLERGKRLREWQIVLPEHIKGTWVLLSASQTPSTIPPLRHPWGYLTRGSPKWPMSILRAQRKWGLYFIDYLSALFEETYIYLTLISVWHSPVAIIFTKQSSEMIELVLNF